MYNPTEAAARYSPVPQQPAPMPAQKRRQTGPTWLPLVAAIICAAFGLIYAFGIYAGNQPPSQAEQKFVSDIRVNWPVNAQPYTDAQLIDAGDRVCSADRWSRETNGWLADGNELLAKMRDIDQIKDNTLRHGILGVARSNGGLCS